MEQVINCEYFTEYLINWKSKVFYAFPENKFPLFSL